MNCKPVDFYEGDRFCVELARTGPDSTLGLILHTDGREPRSVPEITFHAIALVPPNEDEITRHVRFANRIGKKLKVRNLVKQIDCFLKTCLELDEPYRFLLACFVLSTWVVDLLPVAPYIAFVGLPESGKSTALAALY